MEECSVFSTIPGFSARRKYPFRKSLFLEILSFDFFPKDLIPPHFTQFDPQSFWMTSGVLKAPKLRDLSLRCIERAQLNEDVTRLPINWSQLTNISLERFSYHQPSLSQGRTNYSPYVGI